MPKVGMVLMCILFFQNTSIMAENPNASVVDKIFNDFACLVLVRITRNKINNDNDNS